MVDLVGGQIRRCQRAGNSLALCEPGLEAGSIRCVVTMIQVAMIVKV